jgi:ferric-dicitrate binding protein FerR (iron transport regulator)
MNPAKPREPSEPHCQLSASLRQLVAEGTAIGELDADGRDRLWRSLARRARRPRWRPGRLLWVAATVALVAWAANHRRPHDSRTQGEVVAPALTSVPAPASVMPSTTQSRLVHLGSRADLELRSDAQVTLPAGVDANQRGPYRVRLDRGRMLATAGHREADEPLTVETPQVVVVVVGTRFSVEVTDGLTLVAVQEGRVRVERGDHTLLVSAGESIRSDDARLNDVRPVATCMELSGLDDRRGCLRRAADGHGLAGENALFALALLERDQGRQRASLAHLREYQRRFPTGALAPEVSVALATALANAGERSQACAEAAAFARRFPREKTAHEHLRRICPP